MFSIYFKFNEKLINGMRTTGFVMSLQEQKDNKKQNCKSEYLFLTQLMHEWNIHFHNLFEKLSDSKNF